MAFSFLLLLLALIAFPVDEAVAQLPDSAVERKLNQLIERAPTSRLGLVVVDMSTGQRVFDHNGSVPYTPASVMKVVTSGAALRRLEPGYQFSTEILGQGTLPGTLKRLVVEGGGDPSLTIESAWMIARQLKKMGVKGVETLILDGSAFEGTHSRVGARAYETGAAPLAFNFNSVAFDVCPTLPGREAVVSIDPWESGIALLGRVMTVAGSKHKLSIDEVAQKNGVIRYSASGTVGATSGCNTYYRSISNPAHYFATTFVGLLHSVGIAVRGKPVEGVSRGDDTLLFTHNSKVLSDVLEDLNHYSNNFIAEQLIFALGEGSNGRMNREQGIATVASYLRGLRHSDREFRIVDGSGLSHDNRLSADVVISVLQDLARDESVRPEFEHSLSRSGMSGTLKKRDHGVDKILLRGKTGTLTGVSALAGYLLSQSGRRYAFAIIQNQVSSRDDALTFEDRCIETLYRVG